MDGLALGSRATTLPSYTLDLATVIQTHIVDNIIDIQFLHGYNQPTLLILYEPLKTYAGRIAVRKDTCRLDVVTLDVKERLAAFIWSRYFVKILVKCWHQFFFLQRSSTL